MEDKMRKFFISLLFLVIFNISLFAGDEIKISEIMKKIENNIENVKDGEVKNFTGDIYFKLSFGKNTYMTIKPYMEKIFEREIPEEINIKGKFIGSFSTGKLDNFLIKGNSEIGSFIFMTKGDNFKLLLPDLQIQIEDKISTVNEFAKQNKDIKKEIDKLKAPKIDFYINKVKLKKGLDELNKMISNIEVKNKKEGDENLYAFDVDLGKINVLVYEKYYTIKEITFSNRSGNLIFSFPKPKNETNITLFNFLPEKVNLDIKNGNDILNLKLENLKYNRFLDENDFKIRNLNFPELLNYIYFKLF